MTAKNRLVCLKSPRCVHPVRIVYVEGFFFSDNRVLAEPFVTLPTRKELPDYYQLIKIPIDIRKIKVNGYDLFQVWYNYASVVPRGRGYCHQPQHFKLEGG